MKIYDERQFIGLDNLDKAFKMNRRVTVAAILSIPIIVIVFLIGYISVSNNSKNSIYLLTQDGVSILKKTTVKENREVEGIRHISLFYTRFLDLEPNNESIEKNLEECYYLGGDDIKELVEYYKESGFYDKIIRDNITMRHEIDDKDIIIDMSSYPYKVKATGKQILIRKSNRVERTFNITCTLYDVQDRTRLNPHAFRIEDLMIIENKEIEQ